MTVEHLGALPTGFSLQEYRIERILGYGGFGITYLATDTNLDKSVAIKEYLPNELAVRTDGSTVKAKTRDDQDDFRWGLDRFLDEARTLARFRHPNLVPVHRFFELHGTAYMVMEYEPGESLNDILRRTTERAPESEVRGLLSGVLSGLDAVHKAGFLHRDIKPSNIIVRPDGTPVLIDFGAARQALGRRSRNITSIVTPGYAPLEQYTTEGNQGPWTDIYATGAVLYQIVTGKAPPDATARARNDPYRPLGLDTASPYSQELREAIDWALRFDEQDRPQTIAQWREALDGHTAVPPLVHNDQITRLVSSDRQTVANPPAGGGAARPISRPSGRHSVLENAAPGAVGPISGSPGQTQLVPPPGGGGTGSAPRRTLYIALAFGGVLLAAAGAGAVLLLKGSDPVQVVGDPTKQQTDAQKKAAEDAQKKAAADAQKKIDDAKKAEDAKKAADDAQKKLDDAQKKTNDDGPKKPVEQKKAAAAKLDLDKTDPGKPDIDKNDSTTTDKQLSDNPSANAESSVRSASLARAAAVDARRIASDARSVADAARERGRVAREQIAPAARKAAGPGAKTVKLASGAVYMGVLVDDRRQGLGVLTTPAGYRYEGQWADDAANGLGVSIDANKERYEGEWRSGDRGGRGVYSWPSQQKFEGEYRDGVRNGLGVLTHPDNERQEGQWANGKANGRGVLIFADRARYEGEFSDGKFNGHGVYTWADGQRFEGSYSEDKRKGYGILYLPDGSRQSGLWEGTTLTRAD